MDREQFFRELCTVLGREGFTTQPEQDDLLPVEWDNNSGGYILFGVGDRPLIILKKCGFVNRNLGLNTECCPNFFCCCPGCSHK